MLAHHSCLVGPCHAGDGEDGEEVDPAAAAAWGPSRPAAKRRRAGTPYEGRRAKQRKSLAGG